MIPHQLQLKNFLSYGPEVQTINFSDYHLICFTGKNGHGKSALLDAITWAIWGQARKTTGTSKADLGLIHLGQKHMLVALNFEVNKQQYRVRREVVRTASSTPYVSLDFGIIESPEKTISLTDKTIKATQEKIEKTIGITYDTFVNSTFLRQGQANEFSKKSPKERKEILADILQLEQFENRKKTALLKAKEITHNQQIQTSIQARIMAELEELKDLPMIWTAAKEEITKIEAEIQLLKKDEKLLVHNKAEHIKQQQEKTSFEQQKNTLLKNLDITQKELHELTALWETTNTRLVELNNDNCKKIKQELEEKTKIFQKAIQTQLLLKEEYVKYKDLQVAFEQRHQKEFDQQFYALQSSLVKWNEQINQLEKQLIHQQNESDILAKDIASYEQQINNYQKTINLQEPKIKELAAQEELFDKKKELYQKLCAQGTMVKQQLADLEQKAHLTEHSEQPNCPLCEQSLSADQKLFIKDKINAEATTNNELIATLKTKIVDLKSELVAEHAALAILKKENELIGQLKIKVEEQQKEKNKKSLLQTKLQETFVALKKELETIVAQQKQTELAMQLLQKQKQEQFAGEEYKKIMAELATIEQKIKEATFSHEEQKKVEAQLEDIAKKELMLIDIDKERAEQTERKSVIISLNKTVQITEQQIAELVKSIDRINADVSYSSIEEQAKKIEEQLLVSMKQQNDLLMYIGSLEQKQTKQASLQKEETKITADIKTMVKEIKDYQEIAKALGKDGIQALLIEEAIPEIEHEANLLLASLTNNQTQIFIESLRDLKKGGSKETLDIKISDPAGLRPYELFSGGEAFRIDFALRIGISKLLAHRSGTSLQTIFIDEGFGSQDEDGLQAIMDCILKIQASFAKIIIVSHLPELKEQFPVQFFVQKKQSGSVVTVIEQG